MKTRTLRGSVLVAVKRFWCLIANSPVNSEIGDPDESLHCVLLARCEI